MVVLHFLRFLDAVTHESQLQREFDECVACCDVYMIRDAGTVNTIHSIIPGVSFERPHQYHFLKLFVVPRSSDDDSKKGTFRWHEAVLTDCSRFRQSHSCFIYCKRLIMYHCTVLRTPSMRTLSVFSQVPFHLRFHLL